MATPCTTVPPSSETVIRQAKPSDLPNLVRFIQAMAQESEGRHLDKNTLTTGVQSIFKESSRGTYWVMEDLTTHELAGSTLVTVEWSDWNHAPYWWLQSVYIRPEYRGKGLMKTFVDFMEAEARKAEVVEIRLYVESQNQRAIRAYEKTGFGAGHYQIMIKPLSKTKSSTVTLPQMK